jgi:hypothetical protein
MHTCMYIYICIYREWSPYWVQSALRPLLPYCTCPGWLWWWRSWWNEQILQGKAKYSEKTCPDATLSTKNPTCKTRARTRAAAVWSQWLTASAMARPFLKFTVCIADMHQLFSGICTRWEILGNFIWDKETALQLNVSVQELAL